MSAATNDSSPQPRLRQVGRFRLVAEIARGGMGVVYLATAPGDDGEDELFAVKTLLPEYAGEEQYRRMFLAEANLGVRLEHPNIVHTVEVGGSKKHHFMALEYLQGQTLRAVRKSVGELTPHDGLRIISDVLSALSYAHTLCDLDGEPLNIVHRDLSPENVFITYDRRVVLLDFGVAKADDANGRTEVGKLKGRIRYMAPEQVLGAGVDGRADVFAAGILLWEILSKRRFWSGVEEVTILRQLLEGDIPRTPDGEWPERLLAVCAKALAPKPDARFASAEEMRLELDAAALDIGPPSSLTHLSRQMLVTFADARARVDALVLASKNGGDGDEEAPLPSVASRLSEATLGSKSGARSRSLGSSPAGVVEVTDPRSGPASRSRVGLVAALVVGSALLIGGIGLRAARTPPGAAAKPAAPASAPLDPGAPATTLPSSPTAAAIVELMVETTPANAQATLDGVLLTGGSPYRRKLERDDKAHVLEISAAGYEPRSETVVLNGNVTLRLSLDKVDPKRPRAPKKTVGAGGAAAAEAPPPPATGTPIIKGGEPPKRDINTANPYGN